tara:strand:- start:650 stop:841 length:192 start_codon:yes stop_codon:yes gene_type:complete
VHYEITKKTDGFWYECWFHSSVLQPLAENESGLIGASLGPFITAQEAEAAAKQFMKTLPPDTY